MTKPFVRFALTALATALGACAADPTYSAGASLNGLRGQARSVTNADLGYGLHGDVTFHGDTPFRAGLGLNLFPGSGSGSSLQDLQAYGDMLVKLPVDQLQLVFGLSLNRWKVDAKGPAGTSSSSVDGLKFGARLGLDYAITRNLSAQALLQVSELGTTSVFKQNGDKRVGPEGINPAWIQLGVRYTF